MVEQNQSNPVDQMGAVMEKKVGGKLTIGQYYKFQWKYYMWLLIAAVVVGGLSLIPSLFVALSFLNWLVYLFAAFVYFWFGYQLAKQNRGELKDALIGGGFLGLGHGIIAGVLGAIASFIFYRSLTAGLGTFGVAGVASGGFAIGSLITTIIGAIIGGLIVSLIGFAVGGGFSKPSANKTV